MACSPCLYQVDDTEVINFLLTTEIIPLCLRTMEMGSELSKTVATFIVQKILLDDVGPWLLPVHVTLPSSAPRGRAGARRWLPQNIARVLRLWSAPGLIKVKVAA